MFVGFQEYHKQAVAAQTLLTDGSLRVWTETIKKFPRVETFKYGGLNLIGPTLEVSWSDFMSIKADRDAGNRESQPDLLTTTSQYPRHPLGICTISPSHPHDEYHKQSICRLDQARMQARLVEPASTCINEAGACPKALILTSAIVALTPDAPLLPNLQALDFTRLRSLSWEKHLYEDETDLSARKNARNDFLLALLRKCSCSLQELTLVLSEEVRHWPPRSFGGLQLLALRKLRLEGPVHPRRLPLWVARLPSLETLVLLGVSNERMCARIIAKVFPKRERKWELVIA